MLNEWGPAILVCLTLVVGVIYQNKRIDDLERSLSKRIDDMGKRFEDQGKRIDDLERNLKLYIDALIKRLEDRLERLEHPVYRP